MDNQIHNQIVSFIWGIADDCLRDVYVRGKYRDVILPMTVIRRLDALLEDTKEAVLAMKQNVERHAMSKKGLKTKKAEKSRENIKKAQFYVGFHAKLGDKLQKGA